MSRKLSCTVQSRGKSRDYIKGLPIVIRNYTFKNEKRGKRKTRKDKTIFEKQFKTRIKQKNTNI